MLVGNRWKKSLLYWDTIGPKLSSAQFPGKASALHIPAHRNTILDPSHPAVEGGAASGHSAEFRPSPQLWVGSVLCYSFLGFAFRTMAGGLCCGTEIQRA